MFASTQISHAPSYYAASANASPLRPALLGSVEADVCIIGAGYTGLSAGLHLSEAGFKIVVLEQARVGWGASGRNGGQHVATELVQRERLRVLMNALVSVALALPLNHALVVLSVFFLGGFITAFLTLALIASTTTPSGNMASNVSMISMLYTVSAVAGPLLAGATIKATDGNALMWFTAAAAVVMGIALAYLPHPKPGWNISPPINDKE